MAIREESAVLAVPAETGAFRSTGVPGRKRSFALRVLAILGFLLLWHLAVQANVTWPLQLGNLPKPGDVLAAWAKSLGQSAYYADVGVSCRRVLIGIALGLVTAVPLGLWSGLSRTAADTLFTNLELFRPIPLIAYLPVAMLLFRSIESSILFITYIGAFFPILISSRDAAKRVPPSLVQAARILGCGPFRALWRVYLPAMAPEIFTGLSVGIGASWMGVITAEMMSGQLGIGYSTWSAYHLMDYKQSMIGMFTIGALGFGSSALVRVIQHRVLRWM